MKRTCLLLALLCPLLPYAQTTVYEDLSQDTLQTVEQVFEHVDLTQVPSGLLDFDQFSLLYATIYGVGAGIL